MKHRKHFADNIRWVTFSNGFTAWMCKRSFGLYVFHYLGIKKPKET